MNRTDLPIDAMIKFETRAPMRSVRRGQSLIILWWAAALFENFPTQKNRSDIWILGIKFALMNAPYYGDLVIDTNLVPRATSLNMLTDAFSSQRSAGGSAMYNLECCHPWNDA